jgi:hypothetical protein
MGHVSREPSVGQTPAISSEVTRPIRKAPIAPSCSVKWRWQLVVDLVPVELALRSLDEAVDTDIIRMIFLIGVPPTGAGRPGGRGSALG